MTDGTNLRARLSWLLLLALLLNLARAQDAPRPVRRAPASIPKAVEYRPALLRDVPLDWWDEYPAVCLYSSLTALVSEDGDVEEIHHSLVKLNNAAAVEEQGECRFFYEPDFQTITLNEARVHTARGTVVEVRPEHVQVRDSSTDYQVYANTREVIVSFPGLGVGDVIELQWTTKGRDPEYAPHYCLEHYFNNVDNDAIDLGETHAYPIRKAEVIVQLPKSKPLRFATHGHDFPPKVTETADTRTYHWTTADVMPTPQDTPAPRTEDYFVGVIASTFPSWDAVAKFELDLRAGCRDCTAELRDELKKATDGATTLEARVRSLCRFVRSDLRYLSHGHGASGNRPHPPANVLANGFGDCKDKCQLLSVLLTDLDVPHECVLISTEGYPELHPDVPTPVADHIFLKIDIGDTTHFVDPTGTFDPWDQIREDCSGRNALLFNEKSAKLERLPPMKPEDYRIVSESNLVVDTAGNGKLTVKREYHRIAGGKLRSDWLSLPRGRWKETLIDEFGTHYAIARIESLTVDDKNLADPDQPLKVQFTVNLPRLFEPEPERSSRMGRLYDTPLWDLVLTHRPEADRKLPLHLPQAFHVRQALHITLPPTHEFVSLPQRNMHDTPWGHGELDIVGQEDPHQMTFLWEARVHTRRVPTKDLDAWRKFDDALAETYSPGVVIDFSRNPEDLAAIRTLASQDPQNAGAWEALLHMLLDQGQRDEAKRVLKKVRAELPQDQNLAEFALDVAVADAELELELRDLAQRFPQDERYRVSLAVVLIERGKLPEAETLLTKATNSSTKDVQLRAMIALADLRVRQNKPREAERLMDEVFGLDEAAVELVLFQQVVGRMLEQRKLWDDAKEHYEMGLEMHRDDPDLLAGSVRVLRQLKEREPALRRLWSFMAVAETAEQKEQAAQFCLLFERWEDAELLAKDAIKLDPQVKQAPAILQAARMRRKPM